MTDLTLELKWYRCPQGYQVVHAAEIARASGCDPATYPDVEWIMPVTDERDWYRPLDRYPSLWNVFANVRTAADFIRFTQQFGPLGQSSTQWGGSIQFALDRARLFRDLLAAAHKGPKKIASVYDSDLWHGTVASYQAAMERERADLIRSGVPANDALRQARELAGEPLPRTGLENLYDLIGTLEMVPDPSKGIRLRVRTDNLYTGLMWQVGLELHKARGEQVKFRECALCGEWFQAGLGTGRRLDALFCSAQHQIDYNSRKRSRKQTRRGPHASSPWSHTRTRPRKLGN